MEATARLSGDRGIVVTREFDAPRHLLWLAMTDPAHVKNWWGPNGFSTTIEKMDFHVGGVWEHTMHGPDGTNYPNRSKFLEIVPGERIVYAHGGHKEGGPGVSFEATWIFEDLGANRSRLTIQQVFKTVEMRERVISEFGAMEGGKQTLGRLAEYVKNL